ncbi:MAG: type II secretion system inner membrane protein GspF [Coxiellaceae bacterium]|nr:type II secretion system inner membrane protein GspF [Coxiellaceae bacterium]
MSAYDYIAVDKDGKKQKGVIEADSARQARMILRGQGMMPLKVHEVKGAGVGVKNKLNRLTTSRHKMSIADLTLVTRQMATLLSAGIPIDEVLAGVAQQAEKPRVKSILIGVRSRVVEGHTLADSMDSFPNSFPLLYRTTVSSGERSGKLDLVLKKLADYTEEQHRIRQKVQQALVYPSLMVVVSILVVLFLLIYVVPQIVNVFNQTNHALPTVTTTLIAFSAFIKSYGLYVLGGFIVIMLLFFRAMKKIGFRRQVHRLLLRVPVIGKNFRIINCARFGRTFGILNSASVPVLEAMRAAAQLITLVPMRESVETCVEKVREGTNINVALEKTGYFPAMFLHLVASGENSGQLEEMLDKAAESLENDVEMIIQNALTLFEPVMILVMGGIVLYIVLAIMLPIFNLDQFSG